MAGCVFTALAAAGVFLPILPTAPFLILAAVCFARSSERFDAWLRSRSLFRPYFPRPGERARFPIAHKILALAFLWGALAANLAWVARAPGLRAFLVFIAAAVTIHIILIRPRGVDARRAPSTRRRSDMVLKLPGSILAAGGAALAAFAFYSFAAAAEIPNIKAEVVATYRHDAAASTQGLLWDEGGFLEGTGGQGESELRRVTLATGEVTERRALDPRLFGEGVARAGDRIYQLTWRDGVCLVYDPETLAAAGEFRYEGEGWGLTYDGRYLIMSDGSATLTWRDPATFAAVRTAAVTAAGKPVERLNELEYVEGKIYANVWHGDRIAIIDPASAHVEAWLNLRALGPRPRGERTCANGIAYDPQGKRLFVTGKRWPELYEVKLPAGEGRK